MGSSASFRRSIWTDCRKIIWKHIASGFARLRRDDVLAAARRHFDSANAQIVLVGDRAQIGEQAALFGPVTEYDAHGLAASCRGDGLATRKTNPALRRRNRMT